MVSEVGTYLDAQFATLTLGSTLFLGQMPEAPDTACALYQGSGGRPSFTLGAEDAVAQRPQWESFRLQVVVRTADSATSYTDSETLIWSIYRALSLTNITMSGIRYLSIDPIDIPAPLEEDKKGRISFVCNFEVLREPSTGSNQ